MKNYSLKTKANFRRKSKLAIPFRILLFLAALLILLVILGNALGFLGSYITQPIFFVRAWITESTGKVPLYFKNWNELIAENDALKFEVAKSSGIEASLERVLIENEELRALLGVRGETRIAAGILARPPYLPYDSLMIDRGANDGIRERAIVYYADDQAIGYVSEAFSESALITLFSTTGVEGTAYILGPDIFATAHGHGGGVIRISVPQGIEISIGDLVVLPTLERGILGRISEVRSISTEPEQHAFVVPSAPIQSLHYVSVGTRTVEPISFEDAAEIIRQNEYQDLLMDVPDDVLLGGAIATSTTPTSSEEIISE